MNLRRSRPDDWPTIHDRARAALSDQLDGLLDPAETEWLDRHLADCPDCRATADAYAEQRLAIRGLRDRQPEPPRDLWARTAAAIEAEMAGRPPARARRFSPGLFFPATLVATTLVVAVAFGALISSQPAKHGVSGDEGSSPGQLAVNPSDRATVSAGGGSKAPTTTPFPVTAKVEVAKKDPNGKLVISTQLVDRVCPKSASEPCDTSTPPAETSVTIDQDASAVFSDETGERYIVVGGADGGDKGTVTVVTAAVSGPTGSPSPTPSASSSEQPASPSPTPTASPSPSASPIESASPSTEPTASIEITPSPLNPSEIEIAHDVIVVGQSAAYSANGEWFAFTARPIAGGGGPDIYLWRVGSDTAQRVTNDGRSVFGSWSDGLAIGSIASDARRGGPPATTGLEGRTFALDPATAVLSPLPGTGDAWRPAVNPAAPYAVYWTGKVRLADGSGLVPESGRLVLGDWAPAQPQASGSPEVTPPANQENARHELTLQAGAPSDWDARWDASGEHLALWIADPNDPSVGKLSLYRFRPFDGSIDLKNPLLDAHPAKAGFALADGSLIWAEPTADASTDGTVQLLAWSATGIGEIKTVTGPALVIR
jgi:hypothetical protein